MAVGKEIRKALEAVGVHVHEFGETHDGKKIVRVMAPSFSGELKITYLVAGRHDQDLIVMPWGDEDEDGSQTIVAGYLCEDGEFQPIEKGYYTRR